MAEKKRVRGKVSCCDNKQPYWDSPYVSGPSTPTELRAVLTQPEKDALLLIYGNNIAGSKPPAGMPDGPYQERLARQNAAIAVIAAGGGANNRIADTWPMSSAEWYGTNGSEANTALRVQHDIQASQRSGVKTQAHRGVTLWCKACESGTDQLLAGLAYTGQEITPFITGLAIAASYIPVFGTAVSFIMTTALNLMKGQGLSDAALDAIGMALPGQPVTGIAYEVARGVARGDSFDAIAINNLPIDDTAKRTITTAIGIAKSIGRGEAITDAALGILYNELPDSGKKAMGYARRLLEGEQAARVAVDMINHLGQLREMIERVEQMQVAAIAAKNGGLFAQRSFIAQAGYQGALTDLKKELAEALTAGLIGGSTETIVPMFASVPEKPQAKATLDNYYAKGLTISQSGLSRFKDRTLSDLLTNGGFTVPIRGAMDGALKWNPGIVVNTNVSKAMLTPEFKRGFLIATGCCDGMSEDGPGQQAIYQSVAEKSRAGFDAGQTVAHWRTRYEIHIRNSMVSTKVNPSETVMSARGPRLPASTATIKAGLPSLTSLAPQPVTRIATPRTTPLVIDSKVYAQKNADRARWVDYYKKF